MGLIIVARGSVVTGARLLRARDAKNHHAGAVLVVRPLPATPSNSPSGDALAKAGDDRAMSLAVASLSSAERAEVLAAIRYATTRLETRLLPLAEDLGDGDPVEELEDALARYSPLLGAARSFEANRWQSSDLDVIVQSECPKELQAAETCVPLWDASHDTDLGDRTPLAGRARFLAWAVAYAKVIDLGSAPIALECGKELREHRRLEGSAIALVLSNDDLALRPVPERDELTNAARRLGVVMALSHRHNSERLEALGRAAPSGHTSPWLSLSRTMLLLVPKLSALARLAELPREVNDSARCRTSRWVTSAREPH